MIIISNHANLFHVIGGEADASLRALLKAYLGFPWESAQSLMTLCPKAAAIAVK